MPERPPENCTFRHVGPFSVNQTGSSGCDVRDGDANIICWTQDRAMALVIAGLLEQCFQQSAN